jgi:alkanesulfonate monooxygenase SsuD/methylene tetrahydromethanopterin reductase-like flavin-dependent oxidoreductase (luciferase family)
MKFDFFNESMVPEDWTEADEQRVILDAIEHAVAIEAAGFHQIWMAEHQMPGFSHCPNPEILFGAMSQRTTRLRFGFAVQLLPANHPIYVSARTALADVVTGGRIDVGTGRNVDTFKQMGIDMAQSRAMWDESVRLLPELWTKRDVTNPSGRYWPWTAPWTTVPRTIQKPHPRLWVAAITRESAVRAGTHGLGCLAAVYTGLDHAADIAAAYKEAAAAASEADQIGYVHTNQLSASSTWICHDAGDDEAAHRFKRFVLDSRMIRLFRGNGAPAEEVRPERGGLMPGFSDDDVFTRGSVRVGPPEEIVTHIRELEAVGFDRVLVHMAIPGLTAEEVMRSIQLFGQYVIPEFGSAAAAA